MRTAGISFRTWLAAATCLTAVIPTLVLAQTTPAPAPAPAAAAPAAEAPPPGYWINGIHLSAVFEAGVIGNPATPKLNIGQSFTDHPNQVQLNQILLGAEKKLDPKATGFDWAFKLSAMYGSDARYTHYLGLLDQAMSADQRNQLDIVEASFTLHMPTPVVFEGGVDVKSGLFATPLGAELIDPSTNPFYSHSYIFNYALPFKHTGFLATFHVTGLLDLYLGMDTGTNTTFGKWGDDNDAVAGILGFGLNMLDGNLTVLALSHMGPENATRAFAPAIDANSYMRYYNDVVVVWKVDDKLTLTGEAAWARDDLGGIVTKGTPTPANAIGVAGYASYTLTDTLTLNGRAEVFRDDNGFFVAAFSGNDDPVRAEKGQALLRPAYFPGAATYGALTLGVTYKPDMPAPITGLAIRPEIRYDQSLGGKKVFNPNGSTFKDTGQLMIGADVILTF